MKIAYLSTFEPFRGGIAQFNASLYNELSKNNIVKAYNFTTQYPNFLFPGKSQFISDTDKTVKVENQRILSTINPITYITTSLKIRKFDPELIITKFWLPFFAPSLGTVYKLLSKKVKKLAILDNVIPHEKRFADHTLIKYFLNSTEYFVCMSNTVEQDLLKFKPRAKYIKLEHPLYEHFGRKYDKNDARQQLNLPIDKKILLFFGFIRKYKGLDLLIEAMKYLDKNFLLVICGEVYGKFDEYQELINKNNLTEQIILFNRYINDFEVPLFFSAADICILPYRSATQSGIIGISYHFDLPVIATDTGSLKDAIHPYNTGLIIEKPEPELIAYKIKEFFSSNIDFVNNIAEYKKIASWSNFANRIIEFVS